MRENGVNTTSMRKRSGMTFHIMESRIISTSEVAAACPSIHHDFPIPASPAPEGASLKTRSEYRAKNRSREASNLTKKLSEPDSARLTAARLVPHPEQNLRSPEFSLPQTGQNIVSFLRVNVPLVPYDLLTSPVHGYYRIVSRRTVR